MRRAVLKQQHPRQRPPLALLAVLAPQRRLAHQSSRLQSHPGDRVAKLVVVLPDQRLVKMPDREVSVTIPEQLAHPTDLGRGGAPGRGFPHPPATTPTPPASSALKRRRRKRSSASRNRLTKTPHRAD